MLKIKIHPHEAYSSRMTTDIKLVCLLSSLPAPSFECECGPDVLGGPKISFGFKPE